MAVRERVRDPIPESVVFVIAEALIDINMPLHATAVIIQFDSYARPSEMLSLLVGGVVRPTNDFGRAFAGKWAVNFAPGTREAATKCGY